MNDTKEIFCCGCMTKVQARLTSGKETCPHRKDLESLPFWKCDKCYNFVGCHHKTQNRTAPLGCIPTKEIKKARQHIHKLLDPIWQNKKIKRNKLYKKISEELENLGYTRHKYHTAQIRSIDEARDVYRIILNISNNVSL